MANNPYDDVFKNIAKLVEKLLSDLPSDTPQIIGFTIIAAPGGVPGYVPESEDEEDDFELIEAEDCIYVTAEVPRGSTTEPYVTFQKDSITLCTEDGETTIDMECDIDARHSSFNVHNGVIDVVCRKQDCGQCETESA